MPNMRSASPMGARKIARLTLPLLILALALIIAGPAFSNSDRNGTNTNNSNNANRNNANNGNNNNGNVVTDSGDGTDEPSDNTSSNTTAPPDVELTSPPKVSKDNDRDSSSSQDDRGSFYIRSASTKSQSLVRFESSRKELARLFVLTAGQIAAEFPDGGFDQALVHAANRARRAEKVHRRN